MPVVDLRSLPVTPLTRRQIAWAAARDLREGMVVNLGIGIPGLVADYLEPETEIILHSENGLLGMGPAPAEGEIEPDLINATKNPVTVLPGGAFFRHDDAFLMIRGGHVDVALMGGYQVSAGGDLANYATGEESFPPAVGGAMDLAVGCREIWVLMEHTTRDGDLRLVSRCTYPLTAAGVVTRIYTNLAIIAVGPSGFTARAMVEGLGADMLQTLTGAPVHVPNSVASYAAPALTA